MPDFGPADPTALGVDANFSPVEPAHACERKGCTVVPMTQHSVPKRDSARRALVRSRFQAAILPPSAGRILDVAIALAALVFTGPLLLLVALLIGLFDPGPVLFRHERIGLGGRQFKVLKFRSMRVDADAVLQAHLAANPLAMQEWTQDYKLRRDPRITVLGRFLRRSSLDELPQIFNVLKGEMSIVGPRPIVQAEAERYGSLFSYYCSVRPGITGVWQVSGRNDVSYERRVQMDALYARQKSVLLDLKLIIATIPAVLSRKGSY